MKHFIIKYEYNNGTQTEGLTCANSSEEAETLINKHIAHSTSKYLKKLLCFKVIGEAIKGYGRIYYKGAK